MELMRFSISLGLSALLECEWGGAEPLPYLAGLPTWTKQGELLAKQGELLAKKGELLTKQGELLTNHN